jgi:hypothetical protein
LKKESEKFSRLLTQKETEEIFEKTSENPYLKPVIEKARNLMASRDLCFRDAYHKKLEHYISEV